MRNYFFCFFFLLSTFRLYGEPSSELFQKANASYKKGTETVSWQARLTAFNEALFLYSEIEKQEGPSQQLNQVLGDLYFELTQYPWAILYYERSLKSKPDDLLISTRLKAVQKKLGLEEFSDHPIPYWRLVLLGSLISQPMRLQLFFWGSCLCFLLAAAYLWLPHVLLKKAIYGLSLLTALLLFNYFALFYFTPIEGIIVSSTGLYRNTSQNAAQLTSNPLLGGEKVRVIDNEAEGYWLKIIDTKGELGYIPSTAIRII